MPLIWMLKIYYLRLVLRVRQWFHPLTLQEQDSLSLRLDFLIFEALCSAKFSKEKRMLMDLTNECVKVSAQHITLSENHPEFYKENIEIFKTISNLADGLHEECKRLIKHESDRYEIPLTDDKLTRVISYCNELYNLYRQLYLNQKEVNNQNKIVYLMNEKELSYYEREIKRLQKGTLSQAS